jgi:hypothetical protein
LTLTLTLAPATPGIYASVVVGTLVDTGQGTSVALIPFHTTGVGPTTIDVLSWEFSDAPLPFGMPVDVNGDGEFAFFDPHILLFVDDGALDAADLFAGGESDDNLLFPAVGADDASVSLVDPFLELLLPTGNYLLAIGAAPGFSVADALAGFDADGSKLFTVVSDPLVGDLPFPGHDHGDFRVTFSDNVTFAPVPEPSTAVTGCLAVLTVLSLRRTRRATTPS